ncbi:hypothetical protein [[Kitasatospora] papulosa]|uniref:hypothetical protein n=1 Tax=[Kitasatospora] papulosa TaxID=1464011 RepID=UPI0036B3E791
MAFSKSHIDRLLKGQAFPAPPWPFTREFVLITSRAAGLSAEQYQERLIEAKKLLKSLGEASRTHKTPAGHTTITTATQHGDTVAALRLEVDLERARHTETRLRYALRDAQFLMTTLWSIISALRDIISNQDVLYAGAHHGDADPAELTRIRDDTQQALNHKQVAHEEADRTVWRMRSLEALWEQARTDVHRLSLHPDAHDLELTAASDPDPPRLVVPQDLLAQSALDDIAAALGRARALNSQEELAAADLERALNPADPLQADDELAILVAATRLPDGDNRLSALRTLRRGWPRHVETQRVLIRLVHDEARPVRGTAVDGLVEGWAGDTAVRDVLIDLLGTGEDFDVDAFDGLVQGWAGDELVRDVLIRLIGNGADAYSVVVEGLVDGWPTDPIVHNCLTRLLTSGTMSIRGICARTIAAISTDFYAVHDLTGNKNEEIRWAAMEGLTTRWKGPAATRDALLALLDDYDMSSRHIALQGLMQVPGDTSGPLATTIRFCHNDAEQMRRAAAHVLTRGWPGDPTARDAVVSLLQDKNQSVLHDAACLLPQGWPGDPSARDALDSLAQRGASHAQQIAEQLLARHWPGDTTSPDS